ncbi:MAG TPA: SIR2 family protein [Dermatophilaceae bacterium]
MLRRDVQDVINSGQAWGFVGAGVSADAGLPSWSGLLEAVRADVLRGKREHEYDGETLDFAISKSDMPMAFEVLEDARGRPAVLEAVRSALGSAHAPGTLTKLIADLPFAGLVTTNYDHLLEDALGEQPGWVSVGNSMSEVPKVSGDANQLVWHLHGDLTMGDDKSHLVLTRPDYDSLYLDGSPAMRQLQGLLVHRRMVFLGFGFVDDELVSLLKIVGRMTDATRPAFAFVPASGPFKNDIERRVFLRRYNIDLIPYKVQGDSHRNLTDLLQVYSGLALRRSISFGGPRRRVPDYDPETTGLLIYNELVGRQELSVGHLRDALLDSRMLALLAKGPKRFDDLVQDVNGLARVLGQRVSGVLSAESAQEIVSARYQQLQQDGLMVKDIESVSLTVKGLEQMTSSVAKAELMRDQFRASLVARARSLCPEGDAARNVGDAAAAFLEDCVKRRALGVAMAMAMDRSDQQAYHMVALLQSLRDHLPNVADINEAAALVAIVQEAISSPNDAESKYLGTALQAGFGVHLLGFDEDTIAVRLRDLTGTTFVLDATTLIPALASGSIGHKASSSLLEQLRHRGCTAVTTQLLVREVAEHARWAQRKVREAGSWQSPEVLEALLGRFGERSNDFLHGFVSDMDAGRCASDFSDYLRQCFGGADVGHEITDRDVTSGLEALGVIVVRDVRDIEGYSAKDGILLDTYKDKIATQRQWNKTWTHDRQVSAEAEALVVVEGLRSGEWRVDGAKSTGAYFVSHSQFLNEVTRTALPPVLRQEAALHWLIALRGHGPESARAVYDGLLWELQERRVDLVDQRLLRRVFKPTIDAARDQLGAEIERYKHQLASDLSETVDASKVDGLDIPTVLAGAATQSNALLAAKLAEAEAKIYTLEREAEARSNDSRSGLLQKKQKGAERYSRRQRRGRDRKG